MPEATTEELIDGIERGGRHLLSFGITSCMDAAVGHVAGFAEIQAYEMAKLAGRLPVRVWLTLLGDPGVSIVEDCWRAGLLSGKGDDTLRVGGVKVFLDGSAGGRTAWMTKPYEGEPDNIGVQMLPDDVVYAAVKDYHDRGYQMVCHAIGDGAIEIDSRRTSPRPGTSSSRLSTMLALRRPRWWVMAKRCASSRSRCSR